MLAGLGYLLAKQLSGNSGGGSLVPVDNYVGQPVNDAELLIENAGLKADSTTEENDQVDAGKVVSQDPPAGNKVDKGETVHLKVSAGKGQVKVPDVTGQSLDDAQSQLNDAGLDYRVQQETSDTVDPGKVTRTDPPGGTQAQKGDEIKLYVSTGKEQVQIPDVSGQDPVTAANTLGAKDLAVEPVDQPSDTVDEGKVISTDPPAGTSVPKGSKVQLIISSGKEQVRVPNVVGLSKSDATTELQSAGFQVTVTGGHLPRPGQRRPGHRPEPVGRLQGGEGLRGHHQRGQIRRRLVEHHQHHHDHDLPEPAAHRARRSPTGTPTTAATTCPGAPPATAGRCWSRR